MKKIKAWLTARREKKSNADHLAKLAQAFEALRYIDFSHGRMGWNRRRIRDFWHRFMREPEYRADEINKYLEEIKLWQNKLR